MREIKFRVWSNPNKRYVQDEDDYYVRSDGQFVEISLGDMFNELNTDRFIFEQYTGIKDKNSKEIYEGDIVKNQFGKFAVVEFHIGQFIVTDKKGWWNSLNNHMPCTIIGNIHQNPELLNEK